MAQNTVGHQIVERVQSRLSDEEFVSAATVEENHKGPFVRAFVEGRAEKDILFNRIDEYPCYVDVVVE